MSGLAAKTGRRFSEPGRAVPWGYGPADGIQFEIKVEERCRAGTAWPPALCNRYEGIWSIRRLGM